MMSTAPASMASPDAALVESISGTVKVPAIATADVPIAINMIPRVFCIVPPQRQYAGLDHHSVEKGIGQFISSEKSTIPNLNCFDDSL